MSARCQSHARLARLGFSVLVSSFGARKKTRGGFLTDFGIFYFGIDSAEFSDSGMQNTFHSERYRIFIALLREVRESRKVSQSALAQKLGQPQTFVSKCETGVRRIDVVELNDWLRGLGMEYTDFVQKLTERWDAHAVRIVLSGKDQLK